MLVLSSCMNQVHKLTPCSAVPAGASSTIVAICDFVNFPSCVPQRHHACSPGTDALLLVFRLYVFSSRFRQTEAGRSPRGRAQGRVALRRRQLQVQHLRIDLREAVPPGGMPQRRCAEPVFPQERAACVRTIGILRQ